MPESPERIDELKPLAPFLGGPADLLCHFLAQEIRKVKQFKLVFGEFIDEYKRQDYGIRNLPALRFYNVTGTKTSQNGWITGDVICDCAFPASLRREDCQILQDVVSGALFQQFRRHEFFLRMRELVPGLNELGRQLSYDKALGLVVEEDIVPLTQFTINFKLDLRAWDDYLTDQARTVEDPFEKTLEELEQVIFTIRGQSDVAESTQDVEIGAEAETGGE